MTGVCAPPDDGPPEPGADAGGDSSADLGADPGADPGADLSADLAAALDAVLDPVPQARLAPLVARLIATYRGGTVPTTPILRDRDDAAAYAAYRMPATHAAVQAALDAAVGRVPVPASVLDLGGGTGAAVWASAGAWPALQRVTVWEATEPAAELGRAVAAGARTPAVRSARWHRTVLDTGTVLPSTDLVTMCYLLGELAPAVRDAVVDAAGAAAATVVVVEPGTPAGHTRVLAARDRLLAAGLHVVAPCPHALDCPAVDGDWCHFAARVPRSSRHRALKSGDRGHEDEKYSYVVATRTAPSARLTDRPAARVVRHPTTRRGLVTLRLCTADGVLVDRPVPRSRRAEFRAARDTSWGDVWPPDDAPS